MEEKKFQGKYRIASTRLQSWDYGSNGMYFITICTRDRRHFLGEVVRGKMVLSHVGILADVLWYEIKNHAKNVELGEFVVMPNHVHGILILNNPNTDNQINNSINDNVIDCDRFCNQDKNIILSAEKSSLF